VNLYELALDLAGLEGELPHVVAVVVALAVAHKLDLLLRALCGLERAELLRDDPIELSHYRIP
jgi:hypothetical protein